MIFIDVAEKSSPKGPLTSKAKWNKCWTRDKDVVEKKK